MFFAEELPCLRQFDLAFDRYLPVQWDASTRAKETEVLAPSSVARHPTFAHNAFLY
jgi:hypothetical protein